MHGINLGCSVVMEVLNRAARLTTTCRIDGWKRYDMMYCEYILLRHRFACGLHYVEVATVTPRFAYSQKLVVPAPELPSVYAPRDICIHTVQWVKRVKPHIQWLKKYGVEWVQFYFTTPDRFEWRGEGLTNVDVKVLEDSRGMDDILSKMNKFVDWVFYSDAAWVGDVSTLRVSPQYQELLDKLKLRATHSAQRNDGSNMIRLWFSKDRSFVEYPLDTHEKFFDPIGYRVKWG